MKEKKRVELTFETHELTIIRFRRGQTNVFCSVCRTHTPHLSVTESVSVLALAESAIFRLAESGRIHSRETADGRLMLCGESLARVANE